MSKVIFIFKGNETIVQCLKDDKMKDIYLKFTSKKYVNINNLHFKYNENIINMNLKFNEIANKIDIETIIMNYISI